MTTQSISGAKDLVSFAGEMIEGLRNGEQRLGGAPELEEEARWLSTAAARLAQAVERTQVALLAALPLPELEPERRARAQASFQAWVDSVEALFFGITAHVSAGNPLVEVLFPHQKWEKLRRGGAVARSFMTDFERRRSTAYVQRMATEPEYTFLPPLLASVDEARALLALHEAPGTLAEAELELLRQAVVAGADAVGLALAQARLLAEAALISSPGALVELGLDAKPRKRAARAASERAERAASASGGA